MFAVSDGGCSRGDEWLHKGIVENRLTAAFLVALYETWRESDRSHMELTLTRTRTYLHTHTRLPTITLFWGNAGSCFTADTLSPSLSPSLSLTLSLKRCLGSAPFAPQPLRGRLFGYPAGADGDKLYIS